jgi:electron transfer flavoprotein alpha subunit
MSVILFAENTGGIFKKAVLEAATYTSKTASLLGLPSFAITIGDIHNSEIEKLGQYGISKVIKINDNAETQSLIAPELIHQAYQELSGNILIISNTYTGKSIAPRVSVRIGASLATNVISIPETQNGFSVKRGVFSGKGFAFVNLNNTHKVIALTPNSIDLEENASAVEIIEKQYSKGNTPISIEEVNTVKGKVSLTEAELVVSAGRGLKGPENWHLVESLADALGAATACSKPVSDMGWRPHAEHVGQTGITIKPNLYIAIGISGAIQHLAGVSSSKVIVAINKDPEAPFFKAADFGIVGDAFEILPKLTASLKSLSTQS